MATASTTWSPGSWRERPVLLALAGSALAGCVALSAVLLATVGDPTQGRHALPFLVAVPLFAGEVLFRHRAMLPPPATRWGLLTLGGLAGVGQAVAWYWNARRQAVGIDGPLLFVGVAEWAPPLGWWPWMAVVAVAGALVTQFFYVAPDVGESFNIMAFVVVVLGGMGNFVGALLGGFIVGLAESLGATLLPGSLKQLVVFALFVLVLLFRPAGLFGGGRGR